MPWAFIFKRVDTIPRHPAQLYEAIAYFIIFLLLYNLQTKNITIGNGFTLASNYANFQCES
jgi:prolipoprotein diacylglyceryltransferase